MSTTSNPTSMEEDSTTTQQSVPKINMAEMMESICTTVTSKLESLMEKKLEEALARSVRKTKELSNRPNAESAGESGEFTESRNGNELPETPKSTHSGEDSPVRRAASQVDKISLLAPSETGSARFRKAFANDEDDEDQSVDGTASITSSVHANPPVVDEEQDYWDKAVKPVKAPASHGPEVSSHIASAVKTFWTEKYGEAVIQGIIDEAKVPENCSFLRVKKCNHPIFTNCASNVRTNDVSYQNVQYAHVAMTSLLIKATGDLRKLKSKFPTAVAPISDLMKDCLVLAGDVNQSMNQLRRAQFKPCIPTRLKAICEDPNESAEWLFGDNLEESLKVIKSANALKDEFAKKNESGKYKKQAKKRNEPYDKTYKEHREARESKSSENYKSSQKPQGGNQGNRKKKYHHTDQSKSFTKKKDKDRKNKPKSR